MDCEAAVGFDFETACVLLCFLLVSMGANSVKGLKMLETVFPSEDGRSVFSDPKLKVSQPLVLSSLIF